MGLVLIPPYSSSPNTCIGRTHLLPAAARWAALHGGMWGIPAVASQLYPALWQCPPPLGILKGQVCPKT